MKTVKIIIYALVAFPLAFIALLAYMSGQPLVWMANKILDFIGLLNSKLL